MDLSSLAIVLLDVKGKIIFSNDPAKKLVAEMPGWVSESGAWAGPLPKKGEISEVHPNGHPVRVRLCTTWLSNGRPEIGYTGLLIAKPGLSRERRRAKLVDKYKFTPAELRLAEAILDGKRPEEAAKALEVTIHTVRTYLKRLYHKLGVHSQSALVCAMNRALE